MNEQNSKGMKIKSNFYCIIAPVKAAYTTSQ